MIYCPQCGTPNKPNSKFCKNCAAVLMPSTDVRCPICGTLNPQSAASCSNCGTRLTTTATAPSDKTTPADTPETITPFNPPELAPDETESARDESEPPQTSRPSFSRPSSEWLKRVQRTPPPETPANTSSPPPATSSLNPAVPEWLREIQAEAEKQAATEKQVAAERAAQQELTRQEPVAPAKPQLSEIKLTGDDYDYSDIGGQVTDEMKAALEANAASVQSVDDEIALARKLLGLDVEATPTPAPMIPEPVGKIETPAPPKTQLSEIKLTGDDYDYSDVGGEVTDEMKAALEANASKVQSVDDEIALARKLLGLEVEQETVSLPMPAVAEPVAEIERPQPPAAQIETPTVQEPIARSEKIATAPQVETPVTLQEPIQAEPPAPREPVATIPHAPPPAPPKPQLSEIKLTGDDYDYSDIGGQVTDEMKAALEANAASVQSVDDEIALARKLLGLDVEATPVAAAPQEKPALETKSAAAVTPVEPAQELPDWLIAPASTAAAVPADALAETLQDKREPEAAPEIQTPSAEALPFETGRVAETISESPAAQTVEPALAETLPFAETVAEIPNREIPREPPAQVPARAPLLESGELPEWLRALAPEDLTQAEPMADVTQEGAMPEWVKELEPSADAGGTGGLLSRLPALDEQERNDLPDWLREPTEPPQEKPEPVAVEAEPSQTPLELPDWFTSAQPVGAGARDPFEVIETSGPLAGVSGILPLAVAIAEPHTLTTPTPARSDGGRIFQTLLAEPLIAGASVRPQQSAKPFFTANHLLYLLIFFAALVPLFLPLDQAGLGLDASNSATPLFYDQLRSVPANSTVLLAFDYSAGEAVELDPAARAIVNDLAARRVNVIALSSNPNGATIAQNILQRAQESNPKFVFVNVGYIPGNEAGLRLLASGWLPASHQDVNGVAWGSSPLSNQVRGMDDLALTVILTGTENNLKWWMEQVRPRVKSPMVAATSALLEPQALNYFNAKQLQASLRGLAGAAELELLTNTAGQAVKTVDALSFVSLLLAGIIIAANVMLLMRRSTK